MLRKACEIHPISVVQQEWSLFTRNLESALLPVCKELGVGIVAYSPLARNLLTNPDSAPKVQLLIAWLSPVAYIACAFMFVA